MINCFNRHPPSHSSLHTYRCWCGSDDITFGTDDEEGSRFCDLECSGDSDLICGGSSSVSLYKTEAFTLHAHKPELFELASSAVYLGCFADDKNDRVLNSVVAASDVTPEVAHQDPDGPKKNGEAIKALKTEAATALKTRLKASQDN